MQALKDKLLKIKYSFMQDCGLDLECSFEIMKYFQVAIPALEPTTELVNEPVTDTV